MFPIRDFFSDLTRLLVTDIGQPQFFRNRERGIGKRARLQFAAGRTMPTIHTYTRQIRRQEERRTAKKRRALGLA